MLLVGISEGKSSLQNWLHYFAKKKFLKERGGQTGKDDCSKNSIYKYISNKKTKSMVNLVDFISKIRNDQTRPEIT